MYVTNVSYSIRPSQTRRRPSLTSLPATQPLLVPTDSPRSPPHNLSLYPPTHLAPRHTTSPCTHRLTSLPATQPLLVPTDSPRSPPHNLSLYPPTHLAPRHTTSPCTHRLTSLPATQPLLVPTDSPRSPPHNLSLYPPTHLAPRHTTSPCTPPTRLNCFRPSAVWLPLRPSRCRRLRAC